VADCERSHGWIEVDFRQRPTTRSKCPAYRTTKPKEAHHLDDDGGCHPGGSLGRCRILLLQGSCGSEGRPFYGRSSGKTSLRRFVAGGGKRRAPQVTFPIGALHAMIAGRTRISGECARGANFGSSCFDPSLWSSIPPCLVSVPLCKKNFSPRGYLYHGGSEKCSHGLVNAIFFGPTPQIGKTVSSPARRRRRPDSIPSLPRSFATSER